MSPKKPRNPEPTVVGRLVAAAQHALAAIDPDAPAEALPHLRTAQERLVTAIDEAMAAVVLADGATLRSAGLLAGLSENAVGPRLARTTLLAAYDTGSGRVTASGVERARYDVEEGRHRGSEAAATAPPMRFRARRTS
ncbi:MAG: hypothetical protein ABI131_03085 [Nostocoides sp.]